MSINDINNQVLRIEQRYNNLSSLSADLVNKTIVQYTSSTNYNNEKHEIQNSYDRALKIVYPHYAKHMLSTNKLLNTLTILQKDVTSYYSKHKEQFEVNVKCLLKSKARFQGEHSQYKLVLDNYLLLLDSWLTLLGRMIRSFFIINSIKNDLLN